MAVNRAEISFPWGTDVVITAQGDFQILEDTVSTAPATQQRMTYIIQQNALDTITNADGTTTTLLPDDLYNPTAGSSARRLLGQTPSAATFAKIRARILAAFALDPGIATAPAPVVTIADKGGGLVLITGSVNDVTGRYIPIPETLISITG